VTHRNINETGKKHATDFFVSLIHRKFGRSARLDRTKPCRPRGSPSLPLLALAWSDSRSREILQILVKTISAR